ncbi:hypothetical protein [Sinomicrobium weinanense]|uniref:Uncharacterized protein n=1 Tax=Sinomicrobium weinanense TaxID=2842200 RepID=A0A926Q4B3_9FLAO|nr:hypothetical protein [Sinomicrobium weinanense]MBC9796901.1 hypothetical protein [Sinomicrobium weinanense]MBU3124209.1 hypothetical protein [Sinomicrobium weinanense]
MPDDSLKKAMEIKRRYERHWLDISGVTAVGVGQVEQGRTGIIVSVTDDGNHIREQIPSEVEGVTVEIQVSGILRSF